jgi:hypothetical protein
MKYYKITILGRGAEVFPFQVDEDQYNVFREKGVEHDELDNDEICGILDVESYFDCPNESLLGVYPMSFKLTVQDENGDLIYETETLDSNKCDFEEIYCDEGKYLIIEDYVKGDALVYDIPLEENFDIEKLRFKSFDIGCRVEIVTDILYDDKEYNIYKSFGDMTSKGYYFHLTSGV